MSDRYVVISALQHLAFCPRQFALIHIEQQWLDDGATTRGHLAHNRVDDEGRHTQKGVRTERSVWLVSHRLRLRGIADMVEYSATADTPPVPVEMKSGKARSLEANKVQLCAQALCLEEAHGTAIDFGFLTYKRSRKRVRVDFTVDLRTQTIALVREAHTMLKRGGTPPAEYRAHACDRCSLQPLCQPRALASDRARAYLNKLVRESIE